MEHNHRLCNPFQRPRSSGAEQAHGRPIALSDSDSFDSVDKDNMVSTADGPPLLQPSTTTNLEPIPRSSSDSGIMPVPDQFYLATGPSQAIL